MLDATKHPAIFLLIAVGALGIRYCLFRPPGRWPERFLRTAASGLIVVYLGLILVYLAKPGYWDPIESSITTVAQQLLQGRQIYHALDAAPRFSLFYGPSIFIGNALALSLIDNPILASKLAGAVWASAALLAAYWALRRAFNRRLAAIGLGVFVVFALWQEHYTYWNRADSLLLLCTSLGLLTSLARTRWLRWIGLSLALGLAVNTKIHAPLFFLPWLAWLSARRGWRECVPPVTLAAVWVILPFALCPQLFSFPNYVTWLTDVGSLPLSTVLLGRNGEYALMMALWPGIMVVVVASIVRPLRSALRLVWPALVMLACVLALVVVGAHPAAGPHHLIPLIPAIVYLTLELFTNSRDQIHRSAAWPAFKAALLSVLVPAWLIAATATIVIGQIEIIFYDFVLPDERAIQTDLLEVKAVYANSSLQMGYADIATHRSTYFRPWLYTGQTEYILDSMAMMDMQAIGVTIPSATIAVFTSQRFDIWLIPRTGQPFGMHNIEYLPQEPLFGHDLPEIFVANYIKVDSSQFYDVWKAKRLITP
jgi:hypothetical protein